MPKILTAVLIVVVVLFVLWVTSLPVAGEPCVTEGASKFYSTGKIAKCEGGRWVIKSGVMF